MIMEEMNELQQMQAELQLLKDKLANREIVSQRLMRKAMSDKISNSKKRKDRMMLFLPIILIPSFIIILSFDMMSIPLLIYTIVYLIFCVLYDYLYVSKQVNDRNLFNKELAECKKILVEYKRRWLRSLFITSPLCIIFLIWFALDLLSSTSERYLVVASLIGGVTGLIGGTIYSIAYCRREMKMVNEIIAQLDELLSVDKE